MVCRHARKSGMEMVKTLDEITALEEEGYSMSPAKFAESSQDGEFLYANGVMAGLIPTCCGPEALWRARASNCLARSSRFLSGPPTTSQFVGCGAYGRYFEHMIRMRLGVA